MVLNDVRNGYVTPEKARAVYGVVIQADNGDFTIDDAATQKQRIEKSSEG
jgi:N-methylhydantoinase B/oxoprolinase/acetone carboxylase alpha subunit